VKAGSLFAGIGGFCLGFEKVGIKTSWAVENDIFANETYRRNLPNTRIVSNNSQSIDIKNVSVRKHDLEPVEILHAGFPCQSFSQAGERKGFDDQRGQLFYEIIRLIKEFKDKCPPIIVLENAPYLRIGNGGAWFLEIMKEIRKAGYWFRETNFAELDTFELTSLPQKRKRLFMVAFSMKHFRNGRFTFPNKKNTAKKLLSNYVNFEGNFDEYYYLPRENRYYSMIKKEEEIGRCLYHLRKYLVRVKEENVCPTLTANMGLGGHNVPFLFDSKGIRKLTEYECLALQGFPKNFVFPDEVSKNKRYTQIGNSVSVPISKMLAKLVKNKLENERIS